VRRALNISLDDETLEMLMRRAEAPDCAGNVSKAMRLFILESADAAIRVRRSIRPELADIVRLLGLLRSNYRISGLGVIIEDIDQAVRRVEEKLARVTTT
jgi:hypothetical protein